MIDAGPFIAAERAGFSSQQTLQVLREGSGTAEMSISAVAYTELIHGVYRAKSKARAEARLQFLREVLTPCLFKATHDLWPTLRDNFVLNKRT